MNKTITIDGVDYLIAPLTLGQVEELLTAQESKGFQSGARTVVNGMRNANPGVTEATVQAIPFPHFQKLHTAVLEHSGLKTLPQAGEAEAPVSQHVM